MPVSSRIKIIKCDSIQEVEDKVNDFLAFDKNIVQLVNIEYRLEFNFVIIEYYIMDDILKKQVKEQKELEQKYDTDIRELKELSRNINNNSHNNNNSQQPLTNNNIVPAATIVVDPFTLMWRLCFPFHPHQFLSSYF